MAKVHPSEVPGLSLCEVEFDHLGRIIVLSYGFGTTQRPRDSSGDSPEDSPGRCFENEQLLHHY